MIGWATVSRWLSRWCWSCFGIAWGLCLLASVATAQGGQQSGPGWESVAVAALGVVSLLIGLYARSLERRVDAAETRAESTSVRLHELREKLAAEHYTKAEVQRGFERMDAQFLALSKQIERIGDA